MLTKQETELVTKNVNISFITTDSGSEGGNKIVFSYVIEADEFSKKTEDTTTTVVERSGYLDCTFDVDAGDIHNQVYQYLLTLPKFAGYTFK